MNTDNKMNTNKEFLREAFMIRHLEMLKIAELCNNASWLKILRDI